MACVSTSKEELTVLPLDKTIAFTALHDIDPKRYPFILESSAEAENILSTKVSSINQHARYDVLFAFPQESLTLYSDNTLTGESVDESKDFLQNVDKLWLAHKKSYSIPDSELPFTGGWFAFLSYELAAQIEQRLNLPQENKRSITAKLTRVPVAIIFDKHRNKQFIIAEPDYNECIESIFSDIKKIKSKKDALYIDDIALEEENSTRYTESVKKIKQYIIDGDVFQVNLSRLWNAHLSDIKSAALPLYQALKKSNPAPFSAYVDYGHYKIISSSPERLVKVVKGIVQTRPIAGTRARHNETVEDISNLKELISHPKERAEHIMLIDLERNDLGRVCKNGSIHVDELMVLESFKHVHHIVSNVTGELRKNVTPGEVIRAVFPGGTITGCPKERCMQIIAELEDSPRGAYTGSLGYINHDGSMDFNILIRTFELIENEIKLRAGAGIVADSIAVNELEETRTKAKGLLEALK